MKMCVLQTSNMEPVLSASSMGLDSFTTIGLNGELISNSTKEKFRLIFAAALPSDYVWTIEFKFVC